MTPQQAFEQQIMSDFGPYVLKVAHQAGVIAGLQNKISELEQEIVKLKEPKKK